MRIGETTAKEDSEANSPAEINNFLIISGGLVASSKKQVFSEIFTVLLKLFYFFTPKT